MGCSYYAYTVIGLKITKQDLVIQKTHKYTLCGCKKNSADFKYCPSCGKTNKFGTYTTNEYIGNYVKDEGDEYGILTINDSKYKVLQINDKRDMFITIYVELCSVGNSDYSCEVCLLSLETLCELKTKLMNDLISINFWEDNNFTENFNKKFKIYTISEIS